MESMSADTVPGTPLDRRQLLGSAAALGSLALGQKASSAGRSAIKPVALPNAAQIKRDFAELVDFGPRLPGNTNHLRFVRWMAEQFAEAGLRVGPCEEYPYRHWDPRQVALALHEGNLRRPVRFPAHYVRSAPTGADGVTGPLVYAGNINAAGPEALGDIPDGAIVVFDGKLPKAPIGKLVEPVFVNDPGGKSPEFMNRIYRRLWLTPHFRLDALVPKKAAGAVIIMDVSSDMIRGNYSPHDSKYHPPLPTLFVGSDAGADVRRAADRGQQATLTLDAEWRDGVLPQLTAVLPGESDEVIVVTTHTDGQNFIEENGCITLLHLARHFATLPGDERLHRTIVFAAWPGHMAGGAPEAEGWMLAHPDIVKRTVAAFTIEHLGATEWEDVPGKGYAPTGRNELFNIASTQGPLMRQAIEQVKKHDLRNHVVEKGPGVTTGAAFHKHGVPHVGCIAGPNYLLGIVPNGHLDKLDASLAARQTQMLAELIRYADGVSAADLKAEDVSLGRSPVEGPDTSRPAQCSAPGRNSRKRRQPG